MPSLRAFISAWPMTFVLMGGLLSAQARLADLVDVAGVRDNQIRGLGVVVGLNGTGDGTAAMRQLAANIFKRAGGNNLPANSIAPQNMAVVMVTATLPPFVKTGSRIDVAVASMGDAKSLRGGELIATHLTGFDNRTVYAIAEGAVFTGAVSATGNSGSREVINHPTAGRVPNGALVEQEVPQKIVSPDGKIVLSLRGGSYATADALASEINKAHPGVARALDSVSVEVRLGPADRAEPVRFLAKIGDLRIKATPAARVVISERNGTIIAGADVVVLPCMISHSNLLISVKEEFDVSQPSPLSEQGRTVVTPRTDIAIEERGKEIRLIPGAVGAGELARALNSLGVSPLDLVTIFQLLKEQGALLAEVVTR